MASINKKEKETPRNGRLKEGAMEEQRNEIKILNALVGHETLLGKLYNVYAQFFIEQKEFWVKIAEDENQHAETLGRLQARVLEGTATFNTERFKPEALMLSAEFIQRQLALAQEGKVSLPQALSTALDLENSLLEKVYYEVINANTEEVKDMLTAIAEEEKNHRDLIHAMWVKHTRRTF